jgi:hypothetical protein
MRTNFDWQPEYGLATCTLTTKKGKVIEGNALCHPDDSIVQSEYVGCDLAELRALGNYLVEVRDNELKPGLAALKQYYYSINQSKRFNPNSYEARMLKRQICRLEAEIKEYNARIDANKAVIKAFLARIEKSAQKLKEVKSRKSN